MKHVSTRSDRSCHEHASKNVDCPTNAMRRDTPREATPPPVGGLPLLSPSQWGGVARAALITDEALLERQAMDEEAFVEHFLELVGNFPTREWTTELFERGLRYPWYRPERSYALRDGAAQLLHELGPQERGAALERHVFPGSDRVALLAIGSNAAPRNLSLKLAHHEQPEDREVLVLVGEIREVDVVAAAGVTVYGAMPATLAASPGTAVRAAVLLVTPTQLTTLTWGELTYRLGRLDGAPFVVEEGVEGLELEAPLAFVNRFGAFTPDGVPAGLGALPARDRRWPAWTQRELLDRVAAMVLGPHGGGAQELTRQIFAGPAATARRALPIVHSRREHFDFPGWTPIAADGTL